MMKDENELNEAEDKIIELEMHLKMSRDCTAELRSELERIMGHATLGRGLVCTFCGEGFGYVGKMPDEATLKAAVDHEKVCPRNPYKAEIARLTDTLAALMADEWRDTAALPQISADGRSNDVLGCWASGEMMVMYYSVCGGWADSEGGAPCITRPTHWQPLPDPPEAVQL